MTTIKNPEKYVLPLNFYRRDTISAARALLGKILIKKVNGKWAGGYIVETEAYLGSDDPACHAAGGKITDRNRVMFGPPGLSYVYFIYGMYYCVNVVAFNEENERAGAVLIRALEPVFDIVGMKKRRKTEALEELTNGPGKLCQALNITREDNARKLDEGNLLIIDLPGERRPVIESACRIGIRRGCELPLRFFCKDNPFISKHKKG